ncbi:MAG: DoxX protein [Rubrivivax sp.]|nr:DoxX protein [Pyrinomonadaceae bacterium]
MQTAHGKIADYSTIYLRLALGAAYLSSVASRFGLWGEANGGSNFESFLTYTAKLNPFLPLSLIPAIGWIATIAEIVLGVLLIVGLRIRETAILSGVMLILFAIGMTLGEGVKSPFDYSVYTASAASFLLAAYYESSFSVDALMKTGAPAI